MGAVVCISSFSNGVDKRQVLASTATKSTASVRTSAAATGAATTFVATVVAAATLQLYRAAVQLSEFQAKT